MRMWALVEVKADKFCSLSDPSRRCTFEPMRQNNKKTELITTTAKHSPPIARQPVHHRQIPTRRRNRRQSLTLTQQPIALRPKINQQPRKRHIIRPDTTIQRQPPPALPSIHIRTPAQQHLCRSGPQHAHVLQRRDVLFCARRVVQCVR